MSVRSTRKPTAERRDEISGAVLRIIGERGLTALSTRTLAEEVGVTTGALFRHFASLDDILREVVRRAVATFEETFPDPLLPPVERLFRLVRSRVRILGADPGLAWLMRSEQAFLTLPVDAVESLRALVDRSKRYLLTAIRQGVLEGAVRSDIEPEALLVVVIGTAHALAGMSGVHRPDDDSTFPEPDEVLASLERILAPPRPAAARPKARKKNRNP